VAAVLAACGSDSGGSDGGGSSSAAKGKPATIKVAFVVDQTGNAAFAGQNDMSGMKLAVEAVNEAGALKGSKLAVDYMDAATDPQQAVSLMTKAVNGDYAAVVVGPNGPSAQAAVPIGQRAKMPTIVTGAGSAGLVETGDQIYRVTPPQQTYHHVQSTFLKSKGVKRVAMIAAADIESIKSVLDVYPDLAAKDGYEITTTVKATSSDTDFSRGVAQVMKTNPDAVVELLVGKQQVTFATQLLRAGYKGIVAGHSATGGGTLTSMGDRAKGFVYPVDFSADTTAPSGQEFVKAYNAKYGKDPENYAAAGWDAIQFLVQALNSAKSTSHDDVKAAFAQTAAAGITGANGKVSFEGRDARVPGREVEWDGAGVKTILDGSTLGN
jgi:branched-chain amino acid transport system substrate-binding protein